jgi:hypothetical protein
VIIARMRHLVFYCKRWKVIFKKEDKKEDAMPMLPPTMRKGEKYFLR